MVLLRLDGGQKRYKVDDIVRIYSKLLIHFFVGEANGYNIPEVTSASDVCRWFSDDGVAFLQSCRDDKMLPPHAKRLICDGYMCLYQSPEVMMYQ